MKVGLLYKSLDTFKLVVYRRLYIHVDGNIGVGVYGCVLMCLILRVYGCMCKGAFISVFTYTNTSLWVYV